MSLPHGPHKLFLSKGTGVRKRPVVVLPPEPKTPEEGLVFLAEFSLESVEVANKVKSTQRYERVRLQGIADLGVMAVQLFQKQDLVTEDHPRLLEALKTPRTETWDKRFYTAEETFIYLLECTLASLAGFESTTVNVNGNGRRVTRREAERHEMTVRIGIDLLRKAGLPEACYQRTLCGRVKAAMAEKKLRFG